MNRSMVKRALRLTRAGYQRGHEGRDGTYGPVTFVAVFPDGAFGSDVPGEFSPDVVAPEAAAIMPAGLRPVTPRVWWKPDNPNDPGDFYGTGTVVVRLDDYGYDEDCVYVHRVLPDDDVTVYTVWDKPHRVKWVEDRPDMVISRDPAVIRATRLMFDVVFEANGFLPEMTGWLSGLYGGRWYVAVEWDPWDGGGRLRDTVSLMDRLRRDYHAEVRLYGTHVRHYRPLHGASFTTREGNEPPSVTASDAKWLTTSMRAWAQRPRDVETWKTYAQEH